jgi:hypothetical protein
MERVLSSRTFRSGRVAKMTYSETDEPDATHQPHGVKTGMCTGYCIVYSILSVY